MFLGNFRGTNDSSEFARAYGSAHRSLASDTPEFFQFSVDDHVLDIMASVDAIRALKRAEAHLRTGGGVPRAVTPDGVGATLPIGGSGGGGGDAGEPGVAAAAAHETSTGPAGGGGGSGSGSSDADSAAAAGVGGGDTKGPGGDDDIKIVGVGHSMGGCVLLLYALHSLALHRDHGLSKCVRVCARGGGGGGWGVCVRVRGDGSGAPTSLANQICAAVLTVMCRN